MKYKFKLNTKYNDFKNEYAKYFTENFRAIDEIVIENQNLTKLLQNDKYKPHLGKYEKINAFNHNNEIPQDIEKQFLMKCYDVYSSRTTLYGILYEHFMLIGGIFNPISLMVICKIFEKLRVPDNILSLMFIYGFCIGAILILFTIYGGLFCECDKDKKLSEDEKKLLILTYFDNRQHHLNTRDKTISVENNFNKLIKSKHEKLLSKIPHKLQKEQSNSIKNYIKRTIIEDEETIKTTCTNTKNIDKELDKIAIKEEKRISNHITYEGRISYSNKRKLKKILGNTCSACGIKMSDIYGDIGNGYIELHHKIPYSEMSKNDSRVLTKNDFCVLCPNCHKMIHKLDDASDIELLSEIVKANKDI